MESFPSRKIALFQRVKEEFYGRPQRAVPIFCLGLALLSGTLSRSAKIGGLVGAATLGTWKHFAPRMVIEDQSLGPVCCHCPPISELGQNQVWLTFDDGPGPETIEVLRLLNYYEFSATFFFIGQNLQDFTRMDTLRALLLEGGHRVANHSWSHRNMSRISEPDLAREILQTQVQLKDDFGSLLLPYFRPPFGYRSRALLNYVEGLGMKTIGWSLNSLDFLEGDCQRMVQRVGQQLGAGRILLFHDGPRERGKTVEALGSILDKLREQNYTGYQPTCH